MEEEQRRKAQRLRLIKNCFLWFLLCTFVFIISTFIHECGHGFSSALVGIPVSTGFNRLGNVFMYPKQPGFRTGLSSDNSLTDFGVPATLLLAVVFTLIYNKRKFKGPIAETAVLSIALCNSLIRLLPALCVCIIPILTGKPHVEDELDTGMEIQKIFGANWMIYVPALISIAISAVCLFFILKKVRGQKIPGLKAYTAFLALAYFSAITIENILDNLIRINWIF
jgi:hypothetical protein